MLMPLSRLEADIPKHSMTDICGTSLEFGHNIIDDRLS